MKKSRCIIVLCLTVMILMDISALAYKPLGVKHNKKECFRIIDKDKIIMVIDSSDMVIGKFLPCDDDVLVVTDSFEWKECDVVCWNRTFSLKPGQQKQKVRLTMDFQACYQSQFLVIPGISWNGNHNDIGNVYRGFSYGNIPWSFASHRTLIPGGTYSEGEIYSVGLFADVGNPKIGISCSLIPNSISTIHRLIIPEEEMPKRILIREKGLSQGRQNFLELAPGEKYTVTAWIVINSLDQPKIGYHHFIDVAWRNFYRKTKASHTIDELWNFGVHYVKKYLWDNTQKMFHLAVSYEPKTKEWSQNGGFAIGWCGRNIELANGLVTDYIRNGDTTSLNIALDCINKWASLVSNNSKLIDFKGDAMKPYYGLATDANMLSDAATGFMQAYLNFKQCSIDHLEFLEIGLGICRSALAIQDKNGKFNGSTCQRGSIGASLIPPLLTAYKISRNDEYFVGAKLAMNYYMQVFYQNGYLWGGALDTQSADKESVIPLLIGNIQLFELTKNPVFLKQAEDVAYYLAAWQITQTIPYVPQSYLDIINYESFGGTSVATVHMCADNYALCTVPYLLRLAKYSKKEIWKERAVAIWNYATQGISDGNFTDGDLPPRPYGSADETLNYTDWGYELHQEGMNQNNPRGYGSGWMVGWIHAMRFTILTNKELREFIKQWSVKQIEN